MKLVHLSDLHLGKRVNEFSMVEDQKFILTKIIKIIENERPDGVIIAGDVYDKSVPSAEAVRLFDDFLVQLAQRKQEVFIIYGNHDSPERLAFGNRLMDTSGIHLSPVYDGTVAPFTLEDEFGKVDIYMLPFIKPAHVRAVFPDEKIESYTDAVRAAIEGMDIDRERRNVLITHQFVTGAKRSESESISVGGADNVDASAFDTFDYVALGHIHGPQNVGNEKIRYCGTPLKYSFSEATHEKSVTIVELSEKGNLKIRTQELTPLHDLVEIKGTYDELTLKSFYEGSGLQEAYVHVTLTDEEDVPDAMARLRVIYRGLMKLDYDNKRTRAMSQIKGAENIEQKSQIELFAEFYELQNGSKMSDEQAAYMENLIEKIWEGEQ